MDVEKVKRLLSGEGITLIIIELLKGNDVVIKRTKDGISILSNKYKKIN